MRRASAAQTAKVRQSIRRFGICSPVLVNRHGRIVHGHAIWDAARIEGLREIPVIEIGHLSENELRLLSIALNRLGETGSWDEQNLQLECEELVLLEDLLVTGFEAPEIDALLLNEECGAGEEAEPPLTDPPSNPISRPGDLWKLGEHLLFQGDARDPTAYLRLFADGDLARLSSPMSL